MLHNRWLRPLCVAVLIVGLASLGAWILTPEEGPTVEPSPIARPETTPTKAPPTGTWTVQAPPEFWSTLRDQLRWFRDQPVPFSSDGVSLA